MTSFCVASLQLHRWLRTLWRTCLSGTSGQTVLNKQSSPQPSSLATFCQQAQNQHPHTANVITLDWLTGPFVSISPVSSRQKVFKGEGEKRQKPGRDGDLTVDTGGH